MLLTTIKIQIAHRQLGFMWFYRHLFGGASRTETFIAWVVFRLSEQSKKSVVGLDLTQSRRDHFIQHLNKCLW